MNNVGKPNDDITTLYDGNNNINVMRGVTGR